MNIAIDTKLDFKPIREDSKNIYMFANFDSISDIVSYIKNNEIVINKIVNSLSICTSTYIITKREFEFNNVFSLNNTDLDSIIKNIEKNRIPSKEKIWNRKYSDEQIKSKFPKMSKMDYIRSKKIDSNLVALEYFGKTTTYGELNLQSIEYAEKLKALGVKEEDAVTLCLPNTPELVKLMYAINELGAVCNNIFPICTAKEIEYCANALNSKILFVLDSHMKSVNSIINKTTLQTVIYVTPFESIPALNTPYNFLQKLKGFRPKNKKYISFNNFLKTKGEKFLKPNHIENRITSIQYTSGTTGNPKAVILTDDTFNARAYQYEQIDVGLIPGGRFLHCIPSCGKAFGEFLIHLGLTNGMCNVLVPKFSSDDLINMFKKYHIQGMSMTPIGWLHIIESPEFDDIDLSDFMLASLGGDGAIEKMIKQISDALRSKGFNGNAILGAGATELGAAFSTTTVNNNKMGSSGQLLLGNTVKIINENNKECGFIDEEGNLTVLCRKNQLIKIADKNYCPTLLEIEINKCPFIKYAYVVVPTNSEKKIRICYTTYSDYNKEINKNDVLNFIPNELKNYTEIFCVKEIPQAGGLKVDKEKLSNNIEDLIIN